MGQATASSVFAFDFGLDDIIKMSLRPLFFSPSIGFQFLPVEFLCLLMTGPILIPETLIVWFLDSKTISKVATQSKPLINWSSVYVAQITG